MNSILKFAICVALLFGVATVQAQQKREQRAVWMSAYVSDWPSSTCGGGGDCKKWLWGSNDWDL